MFLIHLQQINVKKTPHEYLKCCLHILLSQVGTITYVDCGIKLVSGDQKRREREEGREGERKKEEREGRKKKGRERKEKRERKKGKE
jgi:hypothetical protein